MNTFSCCVIQPDCYVAVLPEFHDCRSCKLAFKSGPMKTEDANDIDPHNPFSPCPHHGERNLINLYVAKRRSIENFKSALAVKCAFSGTVYYEIDGLKYSIDRSRYLIINEGQRYHTFFDSPGEVQGFCVLFGRKFSREVLRTMAEPTDLLLEEPGGTDTQPLSFIEKLYAHDNLVTPMLLRLKESMRKKITYNWFEESLYMLLEKLLVVHRSLYDKIDELESARKQTKAEIYRRLSRAKDFIESSYNEPIDLSAMAQIACLSKHHFLRLFSQAFGKTPHHYLMELRIEKAAELIEKTSHSITEICYSVGFENLSNFCLLFKRKYGVPPGMARKRHRPLDL